MHIDGKLKGTMIAKKSALSKGLPKSTLSICPECKRLIDARIFEENGKVMIEKKCSEHGSFTDIYWSDVEMYLRAEELAYDGYGVSNPHTSATGECPSNCGLCDQHLSHTCLALIDLTNRCNLQCPICFANSNAAGYVYEPSFDEIVEMMEVLRASRPVPAPAIQFAGGEPTIYPRFFDVIRAASKLGFAQIQVATNGLKLANDPEFAQQMLDAGLHTVYLQFDGLDDDSYIKTRGRPLVETKKKVIQNCRNTSPKPLSTVLVPTILNGVNDDQVGDILKFAIENRDVVRAIVYQPVSFAGRISKEEREAQRYTIPDLVHGLSTQTDFLTPDDFYPVPTVAPISQLVSSLANEPKMAFTAHPHCGIATYLYIDEEGVTPVTRFMDVDGMMKEMMQIAETQDIGVSVLTKLLEKYIDHRKAPEGINPSDLLLGIFSQRDKKSVGDFSWGTLLVSAMHFQDGYNYDVQRVQRCLVHYATPDPERRIIPFCAYNSGLEFRKEIESKYGVPLDDWRAQRKSLVASERHQEGVVT